MGSQISTVSRCFTDSCVSENGTNIAVGGVTLEAYKLESISPFQSASVNGTDAGLIKNKDQYNTVPTTIPLHTVIKCNVHDDEEERIVDHSLSTPPNSWGLSDEDQSVLSSISPTKDRSAKRSKEMKDGLPVNLQESLVDQLHLGNLTEHGKGNHQVGEWNELLGIVSRQDVAALKQYHQEKCISINSIRFNEKSRTPLHIAVLNSNLQIVKYLVSVGADINARDSDGNTALALGYALTQTGTVTNRTSVNPILQQPILQQMMESHSVVTPPSTSPLPLPKSVLAQTAVPAAATRSSSETYFGLNRSKDVTPEAEAAAVVAFLESIKAREFAASPFSPFAGSSTAPHTGCSSRSYRSTFSAFELALAPPPPLPQQLQQSQDLSEQAHAAGSGTVADGQALDAIHNEAEGATVKARAEIPKVHNAVISEGASSSEPRNETKYSLQHQSLNPHDQQQGLKKGDQPISTSVDSLLGRGLLHRPEHLLEPLRLLHCPEDHQPQGQPLLDGKPNKHCNSKTGTGTEVSTGTHDNSVHSRHSNEPEPRQRPVSLPAKAPRHPFGASLFPHYGRGASISNQRTHSSGVSAGPAEHTAHASKTSLWRFSAPLRNANQTGSHPAVAGEYPHFQPILRMNASADLVGNSGRNGAAAYSLADSPADGAADAGVARRSSTRDGGLDLHLVALRYAPRNRSSTGASHHSLLSRDSLHSVGSLGSTLSGNASFTSDLTCTTAAASGVTTGIASEGVGTAGEREGEGSEGREGTSRQLKVRKPLGRRLRKAAGKAMGFIMPRSLPSSHSHHLDSATSAASAAAAEGSAATVSSTSHDSAQSHRGGGGFAAALRTGRTFPDATHNLKGARRVQGDVEQLSNPMRIMMQSVHQPVQLVQSLRNKSLSAGSWRGLDSIAGAAGSGADAGLAAVLGAAPAKGLELELSTDDHGSEREEDHDIDDYESDEGEELKEEEQEDKAERGCGVGGFVFANLPELYSERSYTVHSSAHSFPKTRGSGVEAVAGLEAPLSVLSKENASDDVADASAVATFSTAFSADTPPVRSTSIA